jgi:hypothetical protein
MTYARVAQADSGCRAGCRPALDRTEVVCIVRTKGEKCSSDDEPALTEIPPRYHRPLTTFRCIHAKNALVVKHVLD